MCGDEQRPCCFLSEVSEHLRALALLRTCETKFSAVRGLFFGKFGDAAAVHRALLASFCERLFGLQTDT